MVHVRSQQSQNWSNLRRIQESLATKPASWLPGFWLFCLHLVADLNSKHRLILTVRWQPPPHPPVHSMGLRPLRGGVVISFTFWEWVALVGIKRISFLHFSSQTAHSEASGIPWNFHLCPSQRYHQRTCDLEAPEYLSCPSLPFHRRKNWSPKEKGYWSKALKLLRSRTMAGTWMKAPRYNREDMVSR